MTPQTFETLRRILHRRAGLAMDADRMDLLESRLVPIMRSSGHKDIEALVRALDAFPDPALVRSVIDAMVINETFFFRDRAPFEQFRSLLPALMQARADCRRLRIWCAACSTGQEPYSLAMILDEEARRLAGWRVDIVATDISTAALATARAGSYNQFEVQRGLPVSLLLRYFQQEGDRWRIAEHLRARVQFRDANLVTDFTDLGPFDLVFCRNVLIYFDVQTRRQVLERMSRIMPEDGGLFLGSAETVIGVTDTFARHPEYPAIWMHPRALQRVTPAGLRLASGR